MFIYRCSEGASGFAVCGVNSTSGASVLLASNTTNGTDLEVMIPGTDVLKQLDVTLPLYAVYLLLVSVGLFFRTLAYFALRFLHRKHQ